MADFNRVVAELRRARLPDCPAGISDRVIRRIHLAQREGRNLEGFWSGMLMLAGRPVVVAVFLIIAMGLAAVTTTVASDLSRVRGKPMDPLGFGMIVSPHTLECHHDCGGRIPQ